MKESSIVIKSNIARVRIHSAKSSDIEKVAQSEFLRRYIPQFEIVDSKQSVNCNLKIRTSAKKKFSLRYPTAEYFVPSYDEKDIVSFAEFLLERARQERGIYCIHSSSAVVKGSGVIFWGGASGMGKTRLTLKLSETKDCSFFSDEKTLIDLRKNIMCGGVSTAYLSKPHFKNTHGDMPFLERSHALSNIPIRFFVYPSVEEESKNLIVEQWSPEKFDWHLYEELSRKIRGTSRRIFSNTVPLPSLDTQELSEERSRAIKKYIKKVPCYFLKGSESAIIKAILRL